MSATDKYFHFGLVEAGVANNGDEKYWHFGLAEPFAFPSVVQSLATVISGSGSLTAGLNINFVLASTIVGAGTLSAQLTGDLFLATLIRGSGTFSAALATAINLLTTISGSGSLTAGLSQDIVLSTLFTGFGTLIAQIPFIFTGTRPRLEFTDFLNKTGINVAGPMPVAYLVRAFTYRNQMEPDLAAVPALTPDAYSGETGRDEDLSGTFS